MADQKIILNTKKLDKLIKSFKDVPEIRVGVMGENDSRGDGLSNATIGAIHEFGFGVPMRSFLRHPLIYNLNAYLEEQLDVKIDAVVEGESLEPLAKKMGIIAETVVQDAFGTGGFGKWPAWITPGYSNNTGMLLIDSSQLRNAITSAVIIDK